MKSWAVAILGVLALAGARGARELATRGPAKPDDAPPYAPSAGAAPFVSLGYRELLADLLYVRLRGYFGGDESTAAGVADLAEAVAAADPHFKKIYERGAIAISADRQGTAAGAAGVDNAALLRAIALLESGMLIYPDDWHLPNLAGQIYLLDLHTDDPALRRTWDEKGALLLESAVRKPNAPANVATVAATIRSRLGQQQRAVQSLRELALVTTNENTRKTLLAKIAELQKGDADAIAAELYESRKAFEDEWQRERPAISATAYVVIGPKLTPGFDLADLATGGRDVLVVAPEPLEPLED